MRLAKPSISFLWMTENPLKTIEAAGRTCYKSEDRITDSSAISFVKRLIDRGHFAMIVAMIEHTSASYKIVCDRGVSHEIVRHRLFSYAQESTKYCNYKGGVEFIVPCWFEDDFETRFYLDIEDGWPEEENEWVNVMEMCEESYLTLLHCGWTPQQARSVLPNSLKTEIVVTGNLREWLHFFSLRCAKSAHPQMQEVANMLLMDIKERVQVIFDETI